MAWTAPSLPSEIEAEFKRVLGRRIVELTETPGAQPGYVLRLREKAGYYASLDTGQVQQGLHMFDTRLALVAFEVLDDTDARVEFTLEADDARNDDA